MSLTLQAAVWGRRPPLVFAAPPSAGVVLELAGALGEAVGGLRPFEEALRAGRPIGEIGREAEAALHLLQGLSYTDGFSLPVASFSRARELIVAGQQADLAALVLQLVRHTYQRYSQLVPEGDGAIVNRAGGEDEAAGLEAAVRLRGLVAGRLTELSSGIAPVVATRIADVAGEAEGRQVPASARRFLLTPPHGSRRTIQLEEYDLVVIGGVGQVGMGGTWKERWDIARHSVRVSWGRAGFVAEHGHGNPFVDGESIPEGTEVPLEDGSVIGLGSVAITFHYGGMTPLEKLRRQIQGADSVDALVALLSGRQTTGRQAEAVRRFADGLGPFSDISLEGGLADRVDTIFRRIERVVVALLGVPQTRSTRPVLEILGDYDIDPPELLRRFRIYYRTLLPTGWDEGTALAALEELVDAALAVDSPRALAGALRESYLLGADRIAAVVERRFRGRGAVRLDGLRPPLIAARVGALAVGQKRDLAPPRRRSPDDPPTAKEDVVLGGLGLDGLDLLEAGWRGLHVPPALGSALETLRPGRLDRIGRRELDRLEAGLPRIGEGEPSPLSVSNTEIFGTVAGVVARGELWKRTPDLSGTPFEPGKRDAWTQGVITALNRSGGNGGGGGIVPIAEGASLLFGQIHPERPYKARFFLTLAPEAAAVAATATAEEAAATVFPLLYNEFYRPLRNGGRNPPELQVVWPGRPDDFARPGSTSIFFQAADQEAVYQAFAEFHARHGRRFFRAGVPPFSAAVVGPRNRVMTGVAVAQQPLLRNVGFEQLRAGSTGKAVRLGRLLVERGHRLTWGELQQMAAMFMRNSGVDIEHPAFNEGAVVGPLASLASHTRTAGRRR